MHERGPAYLEGRTKRYFDVIAAYGLWTFAGTVVNALALIKYLEDGQNPYFVQRRVGKDGKKILIIKIRGMDNDETKPIPERITPFGAFLRRTHLDELPQLINVLADEMSIVGPRPLPEKQANEYNFACEMGCVKPGIVSSYGMDLYLGSGSDAAVGDPHDVNLRKDSDEEYLQKATFVGDVKILLKAPRVMVEGMGASFKHKE
jgi:lipopolysaccharide/colanic/teichoic acid biosynthesis glycosyltransferase